MSVYSDDLFTPTLTEEDDAVGFERPWNPWSLVTYTFFFGIIGGGSLLALNFRRLGMPARFRLGAAVVAGCALLIAATYAALYATGVVDRDVRAERQVMRLGGRIVACGAAMALAMLQRKRYRLFQACDLPRGGLLAPGLAALVPSVVGEAFLVSVFLEVFGRGR